MHAARKADAGQMTPTDAAMCKLFASEMLHRMADDAVQIHGGMGLMEDLPIERLWRDAESRANLGRRPRFNVISSVGRY